MSLSRMVRLGASRPVALLLAISALVLWAYWPTLGGMHAKWFHDPQYSHGYLVPAFAAVLLWHRRSQLPAVSPPSPWWGLALVAGGMLLRLGAAAAYLDWLDAASLLPCLAGLIVLFGGWGAFRWSWPPVAFLLFMIPLPYRAETALSQPLQRLATQMSTYLMQTLGLPAVAEGNVIILDRGHIGVVEACSGLSMLLLFFALTTGVAMILRRPLLDRAVILLSAGPIAVIVNALRITATGLANEWGSPRAAQAIFHDLAGWLMMSVALGLLWLELRLLSRILVAPGKAGTSAVTVPGPAVPPIPPPGRRTSGREQQPAVLTPPGVGR